MVEKTYNLSRNLAPFHSSVTQKGFKRCIYQNDCWNRQSTNDIFNLIKRSLGLKQFIWYFVSKSDN